MALRLFRVGLFWRIATPIGISKQRFLTKKSAQKCIDMQDIHGIPVVEYKERRKDACKKS